MANDGDVAIDLSTKLMLTSLKESLESIREQKLFFPVGNSEEVFFLTSEVDEIIDGIGDLLLYLLRTYGIDILREEEVLPRTTRETIAPRTANVIRKKDLLYIFTIAGLDASGYVSEQNPYISKQELEERRRKFTEQ
jgi:hypothetical protein